MALVFEEWYLLLHISSSSLALLRAPGVASTLITQDPSVIYRLVQGWTGLTPGISQTQVRRIERLSWKAGSEGPVS